MITLQGLRRTWPDDVRGVVASVLSAPTPDQQLDARHGRQTNRVAPPSKHQRVQRLYGFTEAEAVEHTRLRDQKRLSAAEAAEAVRRGRAR